MVGKAAPTVPRSSLRRPRSAPSPAYGRDAQDAQATRMQATIVGHRQPSKTNDSHQRSVSADIEHLSAPTLQSPAEEVPRTLTPIRNDVPQDCPGQEDAVIQQSPSVRKARSASPPIFEDQSYED